MSEIHQGYSVDGVCPPCGAKENITGSAASLDAGKHIGQKMVGEWASMHKGCVTPSTNSVDKPHIVVTSPLGEKVRVNPS